MNSKEITTKHLYNCKVDYLYNVFCEYQYPWQMLPDIKTHILNLIKCGIAGFTEIEKGVYVGEGVEISPLSTIKPPVIIGSGTVIRPGAYLRGNVITGRNCVIGNSSELKNCILLDDVQVPHYNYVGDSVLGNKAHLGAGVICSNLKSGGKTVYINREINTNLRKVGAFLADGADIGCGCVLNPGTIIGKNTSVYPLLSLRGIYPSGVIVKSNDNIVVRKEI